MGPHPPVTALNVDDMKYIKNVYSQNLKPKAARMDVAVFSTIWAW